MGVLNEEDFYKKLDKKSLDYKEDLWKFYNWLCEGYDTKEHISLCCNKFNWNYDYYWDLVRGLNRSKFYSKKNNKFIFCPEGRELFTIKLHLSKEDYELLDDFSNVAGYDNSEEMFYWMIKCIKNSFIQDKLFKLKRNGINLSMTYSINN